MHRAQTGSLKKKQLCGGAGHSVFKMSSFGFGGLWCLIERLWRVVAFIPRYFSIPFTGLLRLAINWRNSGDAPIESEINEANTQPQSGSQAEVEHGPQESFRQPNCETQSCEGSEDDEFDSEDYGVDATDELYCRYDSTWESEGLERPRTWARTRRKASFRSYKFGRFENAARDMQNYRHDYDSPIRLHDFIQDPGDKPILEFYLGTKACLPDGIYIQDFHNDWYGEYDALEYVHTYIQWLFPLQEPGMNFQAPALTRGEIQDFLSNKTAKENLLKSYQLMLDFYGITLYDKEKGKVRRASNWRERFNNLNSHTHNNLRITRILKCLGTLGYPHYQAPLVHFFLNETLVHGELPCVKESVLNYFVFAVRNKSERRRLLKFAYLNYIPKDEFVWCPQKIQMMWSQHQRDFSVEGED
ncbi:opioid growth factor receptor-like [Channa argus]|uniref:opioid growth factor receptor-like n=1 Tax=Channa argus TaxID=215402 RepID=UPI0029442464|nr:hypothetical protein Q8A73_005297 [Channa argus]